MATDEIKKGMSGKMDQSIAAFKNNLTKIRTGRANPAILDTVQVEYYGAMLPFEPSCQPIPDRCPHHWRSAVGKRHGSQN